MLVDPNTPHAGYYEPMPRSVAPDLRSDDTGHTRDLPFGQPVVAQSMNAALLGRRFVDVETARPAPTL